VAGFAAHRLRGAQSLQNEWPGLAIYIGENPTLRNAKGSASFLKKRSKKLLRV
jgi:hypothetical protein